MWSLWFKVVTATLPVLLISPLDGWMEEHFYNYITVAAMLILYGILFIVVENRGASPRVSQLEQIGYREALIIGLWQTLAVIPGTSAAAPPLWADCCWACPGRRWPSSPSIWPSR